MLEKKRNTRHKETFPDAEGFSSSDLYSSTAELHVRHRHLQNTTGPPLTLQHYLSNLSLASKHRTCYQNKANQSCVTAALQRASVSKTCRWLTSSNGEHPNRGKQQEIR